MAVENYKIREIRKEKRIMDRIQQKEEVIVKILLGQNNNVLEEDLIEIGDMTCLKKEFRDEKCL